MLPCSQSSWSYKSRTQISVSHETQSPPHRKSKLPGLQKPNQNNPPRVCLLSSSRENKVDFNTKHNSYHPQIPGHSTSWKLLTHFPPPTLWTHIEADQVSVLEVMAGSPEYVKFDLMWSNCVQVTLGSGQSSWDVPKASSLHCHAMSGGKKPPSSSSLTPKW